MGYICGCGQRFTIEKLEPPRGAVAGSAPARLVVAVVPGSCVVEEPKAVTEKETLRSGALRRSKSLWGNRV